MGTCSCSKNSLSITRSFLFLVSNISFFLVRSQLCSGCVGPSCLNAGFQSEAISDENEGEVMDLLMDVNSEDERQEFDISESRHYE